ncbi:MAG: FeoB small GTPase domain-containing protein [Hymenobacter sp.]
MVVTVDASNLRRSLLLFSQLADLGLPAILALNMTDVAAGHGIQHRCAGASPRAGRTRGADERPQGVGRGGAHAF